MNNIPVFIFASGQRCGSTFLQRLINSTSKGILWGEQYGALLFYLRGYYALVENEMNNHSQRDELLDKSLDTFAPNAMNDLGIVKESIKKHFTEIFSSGGSVWGFKEVHYGADVALFLQHLFPEAKIIHITRHLTNCFISVKHWEGSEWYRGKSCYMLDQWARINYSFYQSRPHIKNLMTIRYEDIFTNKDHFIDSLASFLGIDKNEFDLTVFDRKLYSPNNTAQDERPSIKSSDLTISERKLLTRKHLVKVAELYNYKLTF